MDNARFFKTHGPDLLFGTDLSKRGDLEIVARETLFRRPRLKGKIAAKIGRWAFGRQLKQNALQRIARFANF